MSPYLGLVLYKLKGKVHRGITSSSRGVAICFKNNPKAQQKIHALMAELDLVDVWRKNNPSVKRYTWRGPNRTTSSIVCFTTLT
jgi:hypothetical protein